MTNKLLKIKDNVNSKELERYGFKPINYINQRVHKYAIIRAETLKEENIEVIEMGLNDFILICEEENEKLKVDLDYYKRQNARLKIKIDDAIDVLDNYQNNLFSREERKTLDDDIEYSIKILKGDENKWN